MGSDGRGTRESKGVEILEVKEETRNKWLGSEKTFRVENYGKGSVGKCNEERGK